MATVNFMQPDVQAEQDQIQRNRLIAEQLRQQSQQPTPGQMAGRVYVGPSWTQGLARLLQAGQSGQMNQQADADTKRLAALLKQKNQADASGFTEALSGKPAGRMADMGEIDPSLAGMGPVEQTSPAIPPDRNRALQIALGSQNPMIQGAGGALIKDMIPKQAEGVNINGQLVDKFTGKPMGAMIPKQPEPFSLSPGAQRFDATGKPIASVAPNLVPVNGQMVNPQSAVPVGAPIPKQPDAPNPGTNLVLPGPNGTMVPNTPLIEARKEIGAASRANTNNTIINAGEKEFSKELAKLDAKQIDALRTNAQTAQNSLDTVKNLRAAIAQGVYSGGGANAKMAVANMINGITGATPKGLPGSQVFNAESSKLVLDHVKALGANPSNADRDFIEKTVPMLATSPQARDALINFIDKKAQQTISNYQAADAYARKNNGLGGFGAPQGAPPAAPRGAQSVMDEADSIIRGGR